MTNLPETTSAVTTASEPAVLGPKARLFRTVLQAVIGFLVAVPVAVALVPNMDKDTSAAICGIAAGLVVLASAVQNVINKIQGDKTEVKYDGRMLVMATGTGKTYSLELDSDPADLEKKRVVSFKVISGSQN